METLDANFISLLREVFKQMETSRGRLRPILADIAASIEQGFFIDADSDEVTALLNRILLAQEKFLEIEQTKKAASSKKLEQLDKTLSELEENSKREEIIQVLSKISTLILDSDESLMINSVRQIKLQAERLKNTASKTSAEIFYKAAEKFVLLNEIVESGKNISTEEYLEAVNKFPDNPILLMILSQGKLHFPVAPIETVEEKTSEVKIEEEEKSSIQINVHRLNAVALKFKKIKPPPDLSLVIYNQSDFKIEKVPPKKTFSVKSFNNKLHDLIDSSDPEPIFRLFMNTRIFFKEDPEKIKISGKFTKKLVVFIPIILERIFTWGLVDKVTWHGIQFYYLNNFGCELCQRMFKNSSRNSNSTDNKGDFETMIDALKIAWMKISEPRIRGNFKLPFAYSELDSETAAAAIKFKVAEYVTHSFIMLSLTLIGEEWIYIIAKYKCYIEREMEKGIEVKGIFLFAATKSDLPWIKLFDTMKFKDIALFLCTPEGLFDKNGNEVDFDDLKTISRLGLIARKKGRRPSLPSVKKNDEKFSLFDNDTDKKKSVIEFSTGEDSHDKVAIEDPFDMPILIEDIIPNIKQIAQFLKLDDNEQTNSNVKTIDVSAFEESLSVETADKLTTTETSTVNEDVAQVEPIDVKELLTLPANQTFFISDTTETATVSVESNSKSQKKVIRIVI